MEALGRRWEETRAQTSLIRDHVLTFRHLIVENEMKSQQEMKKSRRERESSALKEQQVLHLQEEKAALIRRRHRVRNQIQQYTKFCHFLERTVETSGEFQVLGDVLSRFRTLEDTSRYLQHVLQEAQAATDQVRARASRQLQDKHDEALQLDNQLGRLQADLEEAQNQRLMWVRMDRTGSGMRCADGKVRLPTAQDCPALCSALSSTL
ncbi:coiled-coil domain-containing protein 42-like, partial [Engystomops pustulosus]|uniref:coiled-coil domain-containing protein 42-like n=1 Tax=Engystomops pustulosus TaxID=76066 RepID=UPI003AFA9F11